MKGWDLDLEVCMEGVGVGGTTMLATVKRLGGSPAGKVW